MLINPYAFGSAPPPPPPVTWNPLDKSADITLSSGNLYATKSGGSGYKGVRATKGIDIGSSNGYCEIVVSNAAFLLVGIAKASDPLTFPGAGPDGWGYYGADGDKYNNSAGAAYGGSFSTGDIIQIAIKNGSVWFGKNNVWQAGGDPAANAGAAFTGLSGVVFPMLGCFTDTLDAGLAHFSTASFTYSPPSGFAAWE